jgi:uncharacterized protein YbcI
MSKDPGFGNDARREISRRFVALFKEYVGRGPTRARTHFFDHLIVVVLEDTLTKAERTLAEEERTELVRELRRSFQGAMRESSIAMIEEETGHSVLAALSDHSVEPDFAVEAFVLNPKLDPNLPNAKRRPPTRAAPAESSPVERELAAGMVELFKEYVGRGPAEARAYVNGDLVAVLLDDTLTKAERSLADADRDSLVREVRRQFQGTMHEAARELVQNHLGRHVEAFLSDHSIFPDYALEVFLAPEASAERPASARAAESAERPASARVAESAERPASARVAEHSGSGEKPAA